MPCCSWVLSVVASSSGGAGTPSWLHRLHAKGGLSFPKDLQIDDLLYGGSRSPAQPAAAAAAAAPHPPPAAPLPPPPPPAAPAAATPQAPPPKPNPTRTTPARPNPSAATNTNKPALPQQLPTPPPPPLSGVVSDIFAVAVPSAPRSTRLLKPFRKQSRPRPCSDDEGDDKTPRSSTKENKKETKTKGRKRRRAERDAALAAAANGAVERNSKTDVTVIDSSTEGWKGSKVLIRRGLTWKVQNKKVSLVAEPETLAKGKRRAGLVAKITRDREKERKAAASQGNIAISGDPVKEPDGATEMLKRPRSSEPAPGGQTASPFLLPSTSTLSQP